MKQVTNFNKQFIIVAMIIFSVFGLIGYQVQAGNQGSQTTNEASYLPLIINQGNIASQETPTSTAASSTSSAPTATATHTPTATYTPTFTPTPAPTDPYIVLSPTCSNNSPIVFTVQGFNWPTDYPISLFWNETSLSTVHSSQHNGSFARTFSLTNVTDGTYEILALSNHGIDTATADFNVPCSGPTATPTSTTQEADLVISNSPKLLTEPPISAFTPLEFTVTISNLGTIDIDQQFFIDLYFDPTSMITDFIPTSHSAGYAPVDGLSGESSKIITITAPLGFGDGPEQRNVYSMVDSYQGADGGQAIESEESNNISNALVVTDVGSVPTPTPTPTPAFTGTEGVSGVVSARFDAWISQPRADVYLYDSNNQLFARQVTDENGAYSFENVPAETYSVIACLQSTEHYGIRTGVVPPNLILNVYMMSNSGGCMLPDE